jgi:hypothetical protein
VHRLQQPRLDAVVVAAFAVLAAEVAWIAALAGGFAAWRAAMGALTLLGLLLGRLDWALGWSIPVLVVACAIDGLSAGLHARERRHHPIPHRQTTRGPEA